MGWAKYDEDIREIITERWATKGLADKTSDTYGNAHKKSRKQSEQSDTRELLMTSYSYRFMR